MSLFDVCKLFDVISWYTERPTSCSNVATGNFSGTHNSRTPKPTSQNGNGLTDGMIHRDKTYLSGYSSGKHYVKNIHETVPQILISLAFL